MIALDGKKVAAEIYQELKRRVQRLQAEGVAAKLVAFNVGQHEPSLVFLKIKAKRAGEIGIGFELKQYEASATRDEILAGLRQAAAEQTSAITFQLPLGDKLRASQTEILNAIPLEKDVDLLSQDSKKLLNLGRPNFTPPTAGGIIRLLQAYNINIGAHKILIVGQGELVGKPLAVMLKAMGVSFETADKETAELEDKIKNASLIITATGQPGLIRSDNVQEGVIVIDAGTAESGGRLVGDVDAAVGERASYMTPVPGGVGPVTVAMLMQNVVEAAEKQSKVKSNPTKMSIP